MNATPAPPAPPSPEPPAPAAADADAAGVVAGAPRRVVVSWAVYDLANTIYSAIVMTAFLPPLFKSRFGSLAAFGPTTSLTLLVAAFFSTRFGAGVDRTGRARPGLDVSTNVCVLLSAALFFAVKGGPVPTLLAYAGSLFAYQAALTYYNALLPVVAPPHRRGFVSGLGTGLGYAGIPLALLLGKAVMDGPLGVEGAFLVSAGLMTLGTVPLWLFVRDDPARARAPAPASAPAPRLLDSLRWVAKEPVLRLLLLANFVCADVANTLIQYATVYFEEHVGLARGRAVDMVLYLSLTALVGGLVVGRFADRVRPARLFAGACATLAAALATTALAPHAPAATAFLVLAGGVGVATTWTVGRQLVIRVAPRERCGEALGLYGVTTKASILGTSVFPLLAEGVGYVAAVLVEASVLAVGVGLLLVLDRRLPAAGAAP